MDNGFHLPALNSSLPSIADSDDVEVKKLKDLVKKLEKQNEHLRHRTGKLNSNANRLTRTTVQQSVLGEDAKIIDTSAEIVTTNGDVDDIKPFDDNDQDFFDVSVNDEFSWLCKSPKPDTLEPGETKFESPQDWLKEEMEHPSTPHLSSAKRNIMYKLDGAYGGSSPDLSYLRQSVEKRLFPLNDSKTETSNEQPIHLQGRDAELVTDTPEDVHTADETAETPLTSFHPRRGSFDSEHEMNSSELPPQPHHLPVPSQTMTTAHGLYPAHVDEEEEMTKRPHTPSRLEKMQKPTERITTPPRSKSPALKTPGAARSLLPPSRIKETSTSNSRLSETASHSDKPQTTHRPAAKSSLMAPPSRISRLQQKSGLPTPGTSSGIPSTRKGIPAPRTASPMTLQRRSLPRPSQTSTTMKYNKVISRPAPKKPSPPSSEIWGEDEEVY